MELCHVLSAYSYIPMLDVTIITEEVTALIRYVIRIGYTFTSEIGVLEAESYNQLIHLVKLEYCPDDFVEPLINYVIN